MKKYVRTPADGQSPFLCPPDPTPVQFFNAAHKRAGESGCWLWLDNVIEGGYGTLHRGGRTQYAHRVAWELTHGPIGDDVKILHTCDVRDCVNPAHLYAGTLKMNSQDCVRRGRHASNPDRPYILDPLIMEGLRQRGARLPL